MALSLLVLCGSYRSDRAGIRCARFVVSRFAARGAHAELIDAREAGLPMLDRMYKEHPEGTASEALETLAAKIHGADSFVFVVGEYNWGVQPGLENLTDHFLEQWFWPPPAVASYSARRLAGARANLAWHGILSEMGMVVISITFMVGPVTAALDKERTRRRAKGARRWSAPSRASPRTSHGGRKRPAANASIKGRHTDPGFLRLDGMARPAAAKGTQGATDGHDHHEGRNRDLLQGLGRPGRPADRLPSWLAAQRRRLGQPDAVLPRQGIPRRRARPPRPRALRPDRDRQRDGHLRGRRH